jgi:itaconyl-CoA hydratase
LVGGSNPPAGARGTIPRLNGPFFEDFTVGARFRSPIGRTITQADNIQFSLLTNNDNEIHINAHYAAQTEFKRPLVNSFLTLATVAGLMVSQTSRWGFALGVGEVTLPHPLFEGDTLYADTEVLEARASRSRSGWGIVTVRQRGITQDGTVVLVAKRTFMVPTRAHAPKAHFPEPRD